MRFCLLQINTLQLSSLTFYAGLPPLYHSLYSVTSLLIGGHFLYIFVHFNLPCFTVCVQLPPLVLQEAISYIFFVHFNLPCFTVCVQLPPFVLQEALTAAFRAASQYADTFEPHREFYRENESLDLEAVRNQEHGKN